VGVIFSASTNPCLLKSPQPIQKQGEQTYVCKDRVIKFDRHLSVRMGEPRVCAFYTNMPHSERSVVVPCVVSMRINSMTHTEISVVVK
jgi:hypothetical protein